MQGGAWDTTPCERESSPERFQNIQSSLTHLQETAHQHFKNLSQSKNISLDGGYFDYQETMLRLYNR